MEVLDPEASSMTTTVTQTEEPENEASKGNEEDDHSELAVRFMIVLVSVIFGCLVLGALVVLVRSAQLRHHQKQEEAQLEASQVFVTVVEGESATAAMKDPRGTEKPISVIGFSFSGEMEELSTLYGSAILGNNWDLGEDGLKVKTKNNTKHFRNVEAAFEALKFWDHANLFKDLSGPDAVQCGQRLKGKEDWTYGGYGSDWLAMFACLDAKFSQNNSQTILCREALLKTGDAFLVGHISSSREECLWSNNNKGDGANWLGLQLMLIRDEMQQCGEPTWTKYIQDTCGIDLRTGHVRSDVPADAWQTIVYVATVALVKKLTNVAGG